MDLNWFVVLAVLWALLNLLGKVKKEPEERPRRVPQQPHGSDATQAEGSRLEVILREFERALEGAEPVSRPTTISLSLPGQEEIEDRESLEVEPEVVSLETEVRREERRAFDQDAGAEQLVARRISAAAARDTAISKSDHIEFDKRIRQEPADKTATTGYTAQQLRDAVVWREILGPPVSLRGER